jgi:hypothetical protein
MRSREYLKQLKQTTSLSPRRPREAERYQVVRGGEHYRLVRDQQEEGE